jgi:alpha 1,3-glucosidase
VWKKVTEWGVVRDRPHYVAFPEDEAGFAVDDQYFIGSGLLVKPIVEQGVTETRVYLPSENEVRFECIISLPLSTLHLYHPGKNKPI